MIDPKKIEEWKTTLAALRAAWQFRTQPPHYGDDTEDIIDLTEALAALLAEREEMLAVLRKVDAWMDEINEGCPICKKSWGYDDDIHYPSCRLAALLGKEGP